MMKKLLFFIYVLPLLVFSQNSIGIDSSISVNINETFEIPISLNSDGDFIAFQTDINFNSSAFNYQSYNVDNVVFPNHSIVVNLVNESTLRVVVYSGSNSNFAEGSFNFLNLQFTSLDAEGEFAFNFINTVSDSSNFIAQDFTIQVSSVPSVELSINGGNINQYDNLASSLNLSNTELLKAMQFDLIVPDNFDINLNSIQATQRLENHNLTVNEVATNRYRILIYSSNNSVVNIGSGNLFTFEYSTSETQIGTYQPSYELTEIVNENNESITGILNIAPLLILANSFTIENEIDLGDINLNEDFIFSVDLINNENNIHYVNQIQSNSFTTNIILPSQIVGQETKAIIFNFSATELGVFSETIKFHHSGNESISEINVTANVIAENYFTIQPQSIDNNSNNVLNIFLKNTLPVKGFQFDFTVPNGFSIDINNVVNSAELNEFDSQISQIDDFNYRLLYYDTNNEPIQPNFQSLISIPLIAQNSVSSGYYSIAFSETSVVGEQNQNIFFTSNTIPQFYYSSSQVQNSYLKLTNAISERGVSKKINVELVNDAVVTGVQFDVLIPFVFNPDTSSAAVVSSTQGFSLSFSNISENLYRCLIYSTSNMNIPVGDNSILELSVFVNESAPLGDYELNFSNITLVNTNNQNSSTPPINIGFISIIETTITLIGDNPLLLEVGNSFTDPGAIALDINGNDISNLIDVAGSVDTNTVGIYTLTYTLSDSNGNIISAVSRTVNVVYVSAPTITLVGDNPFILEVGSLFTDPGATALDSYDGDLTNSIQVTGTVDTNTVGIYTLNYGVTDSSGNATTITRTVSIVDSTLPVITSAATGTDLTENSGAGQTVYTIIATDNVGVDSYSISGIDASLLTLTGNIVSLDSDPDYETKSSYSFTVTASDAAGNTSASRAVTFSISDIDDIAPVITSGATGTNLTENSGADQTVYTITATDNVGVDSYSISGIDASLLTLTGNVVSLDSDPDYETKSSYSFTVTASDAVGNNAIQGVSFFIVDVDEILPILTEVTPIQTPSNNRNPSYIFTTSEQGVISSSLTFISNTYTTAANNQTITFSELEDGTYTGVTLSVTDTSGNEGTLIIPDFVIDETASSGEGLGFASIVIYPNPASNKLFIDTGKVFDYELYNVLGQKIIFGKIRVGSNEINISKYSNGIYILKFRNGYKSFSKKIVINQ
jgi:hypothetical protein